MIWWLLAEWSVWGIVACIFYGRKVVLYGSDFLNVGFVVICGPGIWVAISLQWLYDKLTRR